MITYTPIDLIGVYNIDANEYLYNLIYDDKVTTTWHSIPMGFEQMAAAEEMATILYRDYHDYPNLLLVPISYIEGYVVGIGHMGISSTPNFINSRLYTSNG